MTWLARGALVAAALAFCGCGAKTPLDETVDASPVRAPEPQPEQCNALDDDLDGNVDEPFRDEEGRYVSDDHCGACGRPCRDRGPDRPTTCRLIEGTPTCAATACEDPELALSTTGRCVPAFDRLCLPCTSDGDCGDLVSATCADIGGEQRCTVSCDLGCPDGYACNDADVCVPEGGSCSCDAGDDFELACALEDPEGELCPGRAQCEDGTLSACSAPPEVCDEADNDCDGAVDEAFKNARGVYDHPTNCGECGVDCTAENVAEGDLTCGGDPFAPSCTLACPDAEDGIQPGDRIDADGRIDTGCECTVQALDDEPGPVGAEGQQLDVNCDGADGVVLDSFYVAPDGSDEGPGSPTRPLATLQVALDRAAETLPTDTPRPHVFVASGSYAESVEVPNGVRVHGGYRRDFLALEPDGFRVEVRAPEGTSAPGQAALVTEPGAGVDDTLVEWLTVQGRDATEPSTAAFGAVIRNPRGGLTLRDLEVRAGAAGEGVPGADGAPGASASGRAPDGEPPRAAEENAEHMCIPSSTNRVRGGEGGANRCDGTDVSGGDGGDASCPSFAEFQGDGEPGEDAEGFEPGSSRPGGRGGTGGQDARGPIDSGRGGCNQSPVCCGLADFTVPSMFTGPEPGRPGRDGPPGTAGRGCRDPFGRFRMEEGDHLRWVAPEAMAGTGGEPGSGGGGGGAGGGAEMEWVDGACEFPDGLGGGGGGGGAGGCGGGGGEPGTSGGPSAALLIRVPDTGGDDDLPTLEGLTVVPGDGGRGGDGGSGGEGGRGQPGGFGGELPRDALSTPTLAGPFPGERGGAGGAGGGGGGGGGGCGGHAVGIWVTGALLIPEGVLDRWRRENDFVPGRPGRAGRGGGGAAPGGDGAEGRAFDVRAP